MKNNESIILDCYLASKHASNKTHIKPGHPLYDERLELPLLVSTTPFKNRFWLAGTSKFNLVFVFFG